MLAPSGRSVLVGLALAAAAAGAYLGARQTSLFSVRAIEVRGASPVVAAQVRAALAPVTGTSLLALDRAAIGRRLGALPDIVAATYDRDFPHTLRVLVRVERPVAVLRRGADAWLVSARGRILRRLPHARRSSLPRIWVGRSVEPSVGATLADRESARAVWALAPLARMRFPARVLLVRSSDEELTLVLRSGLELRLGDTADLPLKAAVARRILPTVSPPAATGYRYLDVSVPERPVAGTYPQVAG